MTLVLTPEMLTTALAIFALRVLNNALGTLRVALLARQERVITTVLAFFEALVFAVTVGSVVQDLSNVINMGAYCLGFAVGSYLGLRLEARLITSYVAVTVIMPENGHALAMAMRERGFGVTETEGEGFQGSVCILRSVVQRRDAARLLALVNERAPSAFVSVEEARAVQRGYIRPARVAE
jgi:uncharacterized protein YebE (UPF0316 family)